MPYFDEEHPLHEFNKDFYIESGKEAEHIYIFKFESKGAKVVLDLTNKDEPLAFLYPFLPYILLQVCYNVLSLRFQLHS